eukprot:CAMPEP_0202913898 /NCGR_PEP_ID=MMETSP1392-20130828/61745_1 /ASSEMBLY_ACC=CAM_ASM_000868 /TAXON_ID=225041 /ORGANISM="Chlamydomonas chlamydogama, Strain SAG 11-48b" /LENGTH=272 /DNA_ID=CAMNT_0049605341 /DNA_START=103 /DNA_END=918 /DNA_ORIENTATION=-
MVKKSEKRGFAISSIASLHSTFEVHTQLSPHPEGCLSDSAASSSSQLIAGEDGAAHVTSVHSVLPVHSSSARSAGVATTSHPSSLGHKGSTVLKSAKRRAAEALLAARYTDSSTNLLALCDTSASTAAAVAAGGGGSSKRQCSGGRAAAAGSAEGGAASGAPVHVKACSTTCKHSAGQGWCHFDVRIPHTNWQAVLNMNPAMYTTMLLSKGYERVHLPEGLVVYVVENIRHIDDALGKLRASMQDRLVAIDLEWKPEFMGLDARPRQQQQQQ